MACRWRDSLSLSPCAGQAIVPPVIPRDRGGPALGRHGWEARPPGFAGRAELFLADIACSYMFIAK
jgi:hypothetical protein